MSLPPSGEIPQGAIRFNTDSQRLEFYAQGEWWVMSTDTPNLGRGVDTQPGARGIAFGGNNGSSLTVIDYINIASAGNSVDFGSTVGGTTRTAGGACASRTRGIYGGGQVPGTPTSGEMEFITIASTGSATDWGANLSEGRDFLTALSNQTRGLWAGGRKIAPGTGATTIDYVTIASSGQTANDFGDLTAAQIFYPMGLASPTRGIIGGGNSSPSDTGIDFITIATTGNAQDFGTLGNNRGGAGLSNATRGIFGGGYTPSLSSAISYITIASTGDTTNFGDLTRTVRSHAPASSPTRGVFMGGKEPGSTLNIDYILIQTEGNAVDFGDLIGTARGNIGGCSNAHGGL